MLEARLPLAGAESRIQLPENPIFRLSGPAATTAEIRRDHDWIYFPSPEVHVVRGRDLLNLGFKFTNCVLRWPHRHWYHKLFFLRRAKRGQIVRDNQAKTPSFLTVQFPPQHVSEQAYYEATSIAGGAERLPEPGVAQARLSDRSRLVFRLPENIDLPFILESLLDWSGWEPSVVPWALPPGQIPPAPPTGQPDPYAQQGPGELETSIEFPYKLILSPHALSGWAHKELPVEHRGKSPDARPVDWVELWHTRLSARAAGRIDEANVDLRALRAVWARGPGAGRPPSDTCTPTEPPDIQRQEGFRTSMDADDRYEIIKLSSGFRVPNLAPEPIRASRLHLTSLGASGDLTAAFPEHTSFSVREWRHTATLGRDQYVRIVYGGYLYPWGHRANLIQITERKFQRSKSGEPIIALLRQSRFITIEQKTHNYRDTGVIDQQGRSIDNMMPLPAIEILTLQTPRLDDFGATDLLRDRRAFWPKVDTEVFRFDFRSSDLGGKEQYFSCPAIFVQYRCMFDRGFMEIVRTQWNASPHADCPFHYQEIAFAPPEHAGQTDLQAASIRFGTEYANEPQAALRDPNLLAALSPSAGLLSPPQPGCEVPAPHPAPRRAPARLYARSAQVRVPAAAAISPQAARDVKFEWDDTYAKSGFAPAVNIGQVFGKFPQLNAPELQLPEARVPGLFRPDFRLDGLSRRFGSIGDISSVQSGSFDPSKFFNLGSSKLFGILSFSDLLPTTAALAGLDKIPQTNTRTYYDNNGLPERVESRMEWRCPLRDSGPGFAKFIPRGASSALSMELRLESSLRGGGSSSSFMERFDRFN